MTRDRETFLYGAVSYLILCLVNLYVGYHIGHQHGYDDRRAEEAPTSTPSKPVSVAHGTQVLCDVDGVGLSTAVFRAGPEGKMTTLQWTCRVGNNARQGLVTGDQHAGYVVGFLAFDTLPECGCNAYVEKE